MYYLAHQQNSAFKVQDASRIAILLTAGIFISRFFQLQQGDWLLYTIAFIYLGATINGLALQRALKRIFAAPAGFYLGFLFLGLFSYYDYRYTYLLPIFVIFAFWYLFITGEYAGFLIFFLLFFMLFYDLNSREYQDFNILNLVACRIFATFLGCLMVILAELFMFPLSDNAASAEKQAGRIFSRLADTLDTINDHCRRSIPMRRGYWSQMAAMNAEIENFHEAIVSYRMEAAAQQQNIRRMEMQFASMIQIYRGLRIMELACEPGQPQVASSSIDFSEKLIPAIRNQTTLPTTTPPNSGNCCYDTGLLQATTPIDTIPVENANRCV